MNSLIIAVSVLFMSGSILALISAIFYIVKNKNIFANGIETELINDTNKPAGSIKEFLKIALIVILSRIIILVITAIISRVTKEAYPLAIKEVTWLRWDANWYLSIAQYGYQTTGDAKNFIVFLPLYPFLIRVFSYVFKSYIFSAHFLSYVCAVISAYFLYLLVNLDYDKTTSNRVLKYYLILPFSFFIFTPMTEGLFMMLLIGSMYFARKRMWLLSGFFGFCCTLTRLPGVFIAVPVFIEAARDLFNKIKLKKENKDNETKRTYYLYQDILTKIISLIMIPMGFVVYIYINYRVTGDWFKFLQYQKEHWHNEAQPFMETLKTSVSYLSSEHFDIIKKMGIWVPNLLMFVVGLIILWYGLSKIRPSYTAFLAIYMLFTYSPSWLLSGGRYMIGAFPIYIGFALISRNKAASIALTAVNTILLIFYSSIYYMFGALY